MSLRGLSRLGLAICVAVGIGGLLPATAGAATYSTPGKYTLVVPSGVTEMTVTATGGEGGDATTAFGYDCGYPGKGGLGEASFPVEEGTVLDIIVAGKGANGALAPGATVTGGGAGGVGGGGAGGDVAAGTGENAGTSGSGGGGGGGASSVSAGGSPLLVAAGGGGCAAPTADSSTGGGNDGSAGSNSDTGGGGPGTSSAGGAGGGVIHSGFGGVPGTSGTKGQGGAGGGGSSVDSGGGGGGGGYYGGGGGGGGLWQSCCASGPLSGGGGGGGSDYVAPTACGVTSTPGSNSGHGSVTISFSSPAADADAEPAGATCCRTPKITGTATRDTSTGDVTIDLSASRLGSISQCGRAKMSITDPGHGTLYLQVNQHGSTATAHRELVGQEQCLDVTRATVSVPKGGTAHRNVQVADSHISIVTLLAHRTAQGAISLTVTANHFLPACGKRDFSWQSSKGSDTLPVVKVQGSTATAKRTLPSGQDCAPDGTIVVVQPRDPWSHAQRQVVAPAPTPAVCNGPGP